MILDLPVRRTSAALATAVLAVLLVPSAAHAVDPAGAGTAALAGDDLTPGDATLMLAELRVEAPSPAVAPEGAFGDRADADGDGCDTRSEVLLAESLVDLTVGPACTVLSGAWESAWDGEVVVDGAAAVVEHAVPLAEAWRSGAHAWTADERSGYANDLEVDEALLTVSSAVSQARADQDPSTWLPPVEAARCVYVTEWVAVKWLWDLSVDPAERVALAAVLDACAPWALYKLPYAGTIYELVTNADGMQTPVRISLERWRDVYGFAPYEASPTEIVRYPWSSTLYAVTSWPGDESDWTIQRLSFAQWQYAGFPAPAGTGWIPGSTLHRYATATQIFLVSPAGGVPHALTFAQWQATGFAPYEERVDEGFVRYSWDTGIFHLSDVGGLVGTRLGYPTWAQLGFPRPEVVDALPGDRLTREFGGRSIYHSGPLLNRPITYAEWQRMGFPTPEVVNVPSSADKDCTDYPTAWAMYRDFSLWKYEGYGDIFGLDADHDGVPCEGYFGPL